MPLRVRFASSSRVGPEFNQQQLEQILQNLQIRGATVDRSENAVRWLNLRGAGAEYIAEQGRPGILLLRPGATRLEVVEELIHHGQAVRTRFQIPTDVSAEIFQATREIQAQENLLNIARRLNWTEEEIDAITRARVYW